MTSFGSGESARISAGDKPMYTIGTFGNRAARLCSKETQRIFAAGHDDGGHARRVFLREERRHRRLVGIASESRTIEKLGVQLDRTPRPSRRATRAARRLPPDSRATAGRPNRSSELCGSAPPPPTTADTAPSAAAARTSGRPIREGADVARCSDFSRRSARPFARGRTWVRGGILPLRDAISRRIDQP